MTHMTQFLKRAFICLLASQLCSCAQMSMSPPQPSIENAARLRTLAVTPTAIGKFVFDENKASSKDIFINIRSNPLSSPVEGSFAQYLRETLKVELQTSGWFDMNASTVISGTLTESTLNAGVGVGDAVLAARFVVTRAGVVHYEQEQRVKATWDSPFMGVAAIPIAAGQYESLYRKLVGILFEDAAFRQALTK